MGINMFKVCSNPNCKQEKLLSNFGKDKSKKDGLSSWCKECHKKQSKKYLLLNPDVHKNYHNNNPDYLTNYYINNKEKRKLYNDNWKIINPSYHKNYNKKHKNKNPHLYSWRNLLYNILGRLNQLKESSTHDLLKYSALELKEHLDNQGMDWNNDHIDHKIPVTWFKESTPPYIVNDLRNLHPLSEIENKSKGNKYSHPIHEEYYSIILEWIKEEKIKSLVIL
jgi:superfamily II DNA helicase RecQ